MGVYNPSVIEKAKERAAQYLREERLKQMDKDISRRQEKEAYEKARNEALEKFKERKMQAQARAEARAEVYRPTTIQNVAGALNTYNAFTAKRKSPMAYRPKRYSQPAYRQQSPFRPQPQQFQPQAPQAPYLVFGQAANMGGVIPPEQALFMARREKGRRGSGLLF